MVRADELEENAERVIPVVFSTEFEYVQFFGREMLSHDAGAVDLSRIENKTAPVLLNHSRDGQIGVVEDARLINKQGRSKPEILKRCDWRGDLSGRSRRHTVTDKLWLSDSQVGNRRNRPFRPFIHNHPVAALRSFRCDVKRRPYSTCETFRGISPLTI